MLIYNLSLILSIVVIYSAPQHDDACNNQGALVLQQSNVSLYHLNPYVQDHENSPDRIKYKYHECALRQHLFWTACTHNDSSKLHTKNYRPFPSPNNPDTGSTIAPGATAPTITQAPWLFQVEKKLHDIYYTTDKTLNLQLLAAAEEV